MIKRTKPMAWPAKEGGFTLIEMMIVVAIIGILAAIAYPSYTEQVRRSKRSDAETVMMQAAQYMQRKYAAQSSFKSDSDVLEKAGYGVAPLGAQGNAVTYTLVAQSDCSDRCFTITATPNGGADKDPKCGELTLTDTGKKGSSKGSVADCWK